MEPAGECAVCFKQQQFLDPWLSVSRFPEIWLFRFRTASIIKLKKCQPVESGPDKGDTTASPANYFL